MSVTVTIGKFEGTGESLKRATERAIRCAEEALGGTYLPHIVSYRQYAALVARDPVGGWGHCLIADETGIRSGSRSPSSGGYSDLRPDDAREAAIKCAIRHVCQLGWRCEDGTTAPEQIKDKSDRADFESWARWQIRMRALMSAGIPDETAQRIEGGFMAWPDNVPVPCPR